MGLLAALTVAGTGAAVLRPLLESFGPGGHVTDHVVALGSTLVQDVALIGVAFLLARAVASGSFANFGLRGVTVRWLWGGAIGGLVVFLVSAGLWSLVVDTTEQDTLRTLGAGESDGLLWASAVLVVLVAPFVEEIFFRGFCFRAVRNRFGFAPSAVGVSVVFGMLHYTGPETLGLIPPLTLLGVIFCWLYERTGSLWPSIALHMLNNALAFAVTAGTDLAWPVALVMVATGAVLITIAARRASAAASY